jgi:hypothetical protein
VVYAATQAGSIRVASAYIVECAFGIARHAFLHAAVIQRLGIFGPVLLDASKSEMARTGACLSIRAAPRLNRLSSDLG